jgi:hypothetical protein
MSWRSKTPRNLPNVIILTNGALIGNDVVLGQLRPNVRDQLRRALGAPLADRNLSSPGPAPASGVPPRDDRCIA